MSYYDCLKTFTNIIIKEDKLKMNLMLISIEFYDIRQKDISHNSISTFTQFELQSNNDSRTVSTIPKIPILSENTTVNNIIMKPFGPTFSISKLLKAQNSPENISKPIIAFKKKLFNFERVVDIEPNKHYIIKPNGKLENWIKDLVDVPSDFSLTENPINCFKDG